MVSELDILRTEEYLVDVTLCCEGHKFRAHKVILSACSPYFRNVFKENPCEHPVVILKDVSPDDVEALLSFVYQGVVYVSEKKLCSFLQTAELLQIKGLAGAASSFSDEQAKQALGQASQQSPVKRRKGAPVRILKQEDGEDGNVNQMEAEEDSSRTNEYSEDMDEVKNEEDEVSNDESEGEIPGGGGSVSEGNGNYSMERTEGEERERLGIPPTTGIHRADPNLQQGLAQRHQPQPPIVSGQFQVPVTGQTLPELLSPPGDSRNGRRPCPLCTKVISNKSNLLKHMRIRHSDAYNPACCVLCNKIFKNKYSLRAHLNIYHKEYITPPVQQVPPPPQPTLQPLVPPTSAIEQLPQPQYLSGGV